MSLIEGDPAAIAGWWPRNRLWLAGALVMVAASLGYSWHNAGQIDALKNRVTPIDVAKGQEIAYEGARWRVLDARLIDKPGARLRLHPDAALLAVDFEVAPESGTTPQRLDQCVGRVSDDQGRRWDAYGRLPAGVLDGAANTCGGGETSAVDRVRFQHTYEVPRGRPLATFHPEIYFLAAEESAAGSYLRFKL